MFNVTPELIGLTLSTIGEVILAGTVLSVHWRLKKAHKIDKYVIKEITLEEFFGATAVILIIFGYFLQIRFFQSLPSL
jgi:hypothetical protein